RADQIADGVDALLARLEPFVDRNVGAIDRHGGALETDILDIADDADGENHPLDDDLLRAFAGFYRRGDTARAALQPLDRRAGRNGDALSLECLVRGRGNVRVL